MVALPSKAHGMMEFAHPWFFLLAFALPWLWLAQRRSLADLTPAQRRACLALRALLLLVLMLALVGVRWLLPSRDLAVVFALDHSASVSRAARAAADQFVRESIAKRSGDDLVGAVGFAGEAALWQPASATPQLPEAWPEVADPQHTDIGRALEFSAAMLPAEKHRRFVLLSDGNDTADRAAEAAQALGVEILAVPLHNDATPEVLVEKVEVPRTLKHGEPFDLTAHLRSNVATTAKVKLYQNQFLIEQRDLELQPGDNRFEAANLQADGSFITYEVEVIPAQDTALENNRAQATASLRGEPQVLVIDPDEARIRPLADVLRREKIAVEVRGAPGLPKTLEDLQQFDLMMLSDVSAFALTREQMELYRRWVRDFGGGFLMLGGENSFGVGGYFRTPIEQMLPIRMEHEDRQDLPSVALLIVLDRSGSMSVEVQGQTKMSLANQGAAFALNVLQPRDYFGVLAVDVRVHPVVPLAQQAARESATQKIMAVAPGGGGIYIYTSLVEAFAQIRDLPARIKHVIIFSDAADAEEKNGGDMSDGTAGGGTSLDLASAMLSSKITTSVVALGLDTDKDTAFLRQLAERGNGRFYLTSDAT
ncbi:MAG: VWA domain-containing protein, partial [Chthoniobacteraceae bacterium]